MPTPSQLWAIIRKLQVSDLDIVANALTFAAHEMDGIDGDGHRAMLVDLAEAFGDLMEDRTAAILAAHSDGNGRAS